ncbi:MAG TPA: Xaa-Pro peptidase family protein [Candidatus Thermoplasmatota archaeon]|nr:Xaa-Pro peptidase family protein [Candidatus Thermoplasmatota archaeon]
MQRVKNVFRNSSQAVDCIILKNATIPYVDDNFFYVTNLDQGLFEGSCAVLHSDGTVDLLVSELEAESARKSTARLAIYKTKEEFSTELKHLITPFSTIGVNASGLSYLDFNKFTGLVPNTKFVDVSDGFFKSRLIKDEQEIQRIKKACEIADETMVTIPEIVAEGMSEDELAAEINYSLQSLGAERPAFDTISSFGKNTAEPHYGHGNVKLENGSVVLCDFGACYKKYNSDITRTFVFGKATGKHKEMYETVLQAQQIAFQAIKPGVKACDVHHAVHSFIDSTKFKGTFIHSTGHGLGLAVHDGIGFAPDNAMELKENMVLTVEPGVYLPGFGGVRIEDDVVVKKDGLELLTKSSREFIELG